MNKQDIVARILNGKSSDMKSEGIAFAPANIALCKYWGKRDQELNLPNTSSLSISLGTLGARTSVQPIDGQDRFVLNGVQIAPEHERFQRVKAYLDLFRPASANAFLVESTSTTPVAAGLASSASGFAALALALDMLFGWGLERRDLSILARLGSGSACRSMYAGFVIWHCGERDNGMDSYAEPITTSWPELRIGLLMVEEKAKSLSSRQAMLRTVETSPYYTCWPEKAEIDLQRLQKALGCKEIELMGETAESNALAMHAAMLAAWPPIVYWREKTVHLLHQVWSLREQGLPIYVTMDAGPNIKLLFEDTYQEILLGHFPDMQVITPFEP